MKDNKELVFNLTYMRQMKTDRSVAISEREYVLAPLCYASVDPLGRPITRHRR